MIRRLYTLVVAAIAMIGLSAGAARAHPSGQPHLRPVVFVHGFSGGAQQYETQARRFASNGYPASYIEAHEYDSTFTVNTIDAIYASLDARIARLLAATGADKVDLTAHSLGTFLMQGYLNSSPERAARVAHYVNYDGATAAAQPGGVPTLAIWGEGSPARAIVGATNLYLSDQSHTQTVTSAESFAAVYRFLTGRDPLTTRILPEPPGQVRLSGRAVLYPSNVGVSAARLEIFPVGAATGHRLTRRPAAVFPLSGDGSFGPFRALPFAHYEFAIVRDGAATHHFYYQSFGRSDRLIRLLTSLPGQGLGEQTERSAATTNVIVNRGKELVGRPGRRQRRTGPERPQRAERGERATDQEGDRDFRLRRRPGRRDRPDRTGPVLLQPAVHHRDRRLSAGRPGGRRAGQPGLPAARRRTRRCDQHPELAVRHRHGQYPVQRLRELTRTRCGGWLARRPPHLHDPPTLPRRSAHAPPSIRPCSPVDPAMLPRRS